MGHGVAASEGIQTFRYPSLLSSQFPSVRARGPVEEPALDIQTVLDEPLVAAVPVEHPLASRAKLPLRALAPEPFLMTARTRGSGYHDYVLATCRQAGFSPRIVQEGSHFDVRRRYGSRRRAVVTAGDPPRRRRLPTASRAGAHAACDGLPQDVSVPRSSRVPNRREAVGASWTQAQSVKDDAPPPAGDFSPALSFWGGRPRAGDLDAR
jgi:DNA-binding transcriptional LysR family regulator